MEEIIECVVNISEGRDQKIIDKIASSIDQIGATSLIHIDSGHAANRTVFTFFTDLQSLKETLISMYDVSLHSINMALHTGKHPRLGVVDVCPVIPVSSITSDALIPIVDTIAMEIGTTFKLPVYLYELSSPHKKRLEKIRKGEYESLAHRQTSSSDMPDYGSFDNWKTAGGTIIGVRSLLIAYNINLSTKDVTIAKKIAERIRGSGYVNNNIRYKGKFPSVKAIGWFIEEYGFAQVSTNLTSFEECNFHEVYESCKTLAAEFNVTVTGSELIGLAPKQALIDTGKFYDLSLHEEKDLVGLAIQKLGLNALQPFVKEKRIIEYVLAGI